jgi:uncharacterized surface protein with fasciclin (FAS1) repeats
VLSSSPPQDVLLASQGRRSIETEEMNMAIPRWIIGTVAVGALALGAAACGDDDDGAGPAEPSTATADSPAESSTSAPEAPATVVDVAASNEDFSTLVTAVEAADLAETLSGDGPFTVFAPVNDAFAGLPEDTLDSLLLPENQDQLTAVLTYHVVPLEAMSDDLSDGMTVTTVQGQPLTVGVSDAGVTLTDASGNTVSVVQADIEAGNGVVHVIDEVLLPAAG